MDGKYRVTKTCTCEVETKICVEEHHEILRPDTYFVIRQKDVFGAAALWSYCHLIQTSLEIARQRPGTFSDEECDRLRSLTQDLAATASEWQKQGGTRVPD